MDSDTTRQQEAVLERFTRQASHWGNLAVTDELVSIVERIAPLPSDRVLDVAAGSGLVARAFAPRVKEVVAVDLTPAMLERGRESARREGLENIRFVEGAAESLPFAEGEFDLAVTRFSLHHMADPKCVVAEMARVVRGRGRIAIIDLIALDDAELQRRSNALERARDPSHAWTLSLSELREIVRGAGATIVDAAAQDRIRDLEDWFDMAETDKRDELRAEFEAELLGGQPTGLQPFREGSTLKFHHPIGILVARA